MDSTTPPLDTSCQAEYEDGYVHDETEHADVAQYGDGNIFRDILNRLPETDHGAMVRFSVFWRNERHDIDFRALPDNARPIRFRHGYATLVAGGGYETGFSGVDFGAQWNEPDGSNQQHVTELR